jgi:hypothetical protein
MECSFIHADAAGRKKTQEIIFAARLGDRSPVQGKTVDSNQDSVQPVPCD